MVMNPKGKWLDINCELSRFVICEKCLTCRKENTSQRPTEKPSKF